MKIDIEAMAKQALGPEPLAYFGAYKDELHDLARLIVERCAESLDATGNDHCAAAIRRLLED